jgi:hypothetical protein
MSAMRSTGDDRGRPAGEGGGGGTIASCATTGGGAEAGAPAGATPPPMRPPPTWRSTTTSGFEITSARARARSAPATAASGSTISREGATITTRTPTLAAFAAVVSAVPQVPSGTAGRSRTITCGAAARTNASRSPGPGRQKTAYPARSRCRWSAIETSASEPTTRTRDAAGAPAEITWGGLRSPS